MNTMFSLAGTYKVTAKAGQYTLDECSIISSDTPIRPYFIESVDDDPDIRGLTIFLQSLDGEIISKKLMYTTDPSMGAPAATGFGSNDDDETNSTQTGLLPGSPVMDTAAPGGIPADSGEETGSGAGTTAGSSSMLGGDSSTVSGGSYPDGVPSTTEETGEYADVYRFSESKTIIEPSIRYNEDALYVKKLSGDLPPLFLPEKLEAGQYILVFQVLGDAGVLHRADKPIYYIGDSEFTLDDVRIYFPGLFGGSHIVPPEVPIMLETNLAAGTDLEPYLVWYSGKKRVHEGYAADGAARFLWQAPAQTGFHVLKVEAFPFKPRKTASVPIGRIKELSLPVSTKNDSRVLYGIPAALETGFSENSLSTARWYQFFADLSDSTGGGGRNTLAAVDHVPEWLPGGNIFGAAIGPRHRFTIPDPLFTPPVQGDIEGRLLFRFVPLTGGTIFSGSFKLGTGLETLDMNLSLNDEMLILDYSVGLVSDKQTAPLFTGQNGDQITAVVSFEVKNDRLSMSLALDAPAQFLPGEGIELPGPLTGYGTFQLGANINEKNDANAARDETATGTGIINDTGGAEAAFDPEYAAMTTGDKPGAEPGQSVINSVKDTVSITAILDEVIITVTPNFPVNNIQIASSVEEVSSFTADIEETVENEDLENEKTDVETAIAEPEPEPEPEPDPEPAVPNQTQLLPARRTTPVSDRNRPSSRPQAAVEVRPVNESEDPVPAEAQIIVETPIVETQAVLVPPANDTEQSEDGPARQETEAKADVTSLTGIPGEIVTDDVTTNGDSAPDITPETVDNSDIAVLPAPVSEITPGTETTVLR